MAPLFTQWVSNTVKISKICKGITTIAMETVKQNNIQPFDRAELAVSDTSSQRHIGKNAHAAGSLGTILSKRTTQKQGNRKANMETDVEEHSEMRAMKNGKVEMRVWRTKGLWTREGKQYTYSVCTYKMPGRHLILTAYLQIERERQRRERGLRPPTARNIARGFWISLHCMWCDSFRTPQPCSQEKAVVRKWQAKHKGRSDTQQQLTVRVKCSYYTAVTRRKIFVNRIFFLMVQHKKRHNKRCQTVVRLHNLNTPCWYMSCSNHATEDSLKQDLNWDWVHAGDDFAEIKKFILLFIFKLPSGSLCVYVGMALDRPLLPVHEGQSQILNFASGHHYHITTTFLAWWGNKQVQHADPGNLSLYMKWFGWMVGGWTPI